VRVEDLHVEIRRLLVQFSQEVKAASAMGQTDISDASDMLLVELLQETFNLPNLRSLNAEKANFPGLDLADDAAGRAFQVTADRKLAKILRTLSKSLKHSLQTKYPKIQVFVTTERQRSYKQSTIDGVVGNSLKFDGSKDILDYKDLLKLYKTFGLDQLDKIASILRKHLLPKHSEYSAGLAEALERDVANRFEQAIERCLFPEVTMQEPFRPLAEQLLSEYGGKISEPLRRSILLRAARFAALRQRVNDAVRFYEQGAKLTGPEPGEPILALLTETRGDPDAAIQILRDRRDVESVSTMIGVLARSKGDEAALNWIVTERIDVHDLTVVGYVALSQVYIRLQRIDEARHLLDGVSQVQLDAAPYLVYLRGVVRLVSVFPRPDQMTGLGGILLSVAFADPILEEADLATRLEGAIEDLQRSVAATQVLNLPVSAANADWYLMWALLMHPSKRQGARIRLQLEMNDPLQAVKRIQFAFKFLDKFDPIPLEDYLKRRDSLGGLDDNDLMAALSLRVHANDHLGVAALIAKHRERVKDRLGAAMTLFLEVQALAYAKDAMAAKQVLESQKSLLTAPTIAALEAEIARAAGSDPIAEYLRVYEQHGTIASLRVLVETLKRTGNHRMLGPYAEKLYAQTQDPEDITDAARACIAAQDDSNFLRVVEAFPFTMSRSVGIKRHYAWLLLQLGRIRDASKIAEELRSGAGSRDLNLEIALAIDSGQWERLSSPLAAYLEAVDKYDARTLIHAAQLALISGYGPFRELMRAAVAKSDVGAEVLLGAYTIAIEGGLEDHEPSPYEWFTRALALSGPDGLVQRMEIKDLLDKQIEWTKYSRTVNDAIIGGDVPLVAAVPALRMTLVDVLLGNFIRNLEQKDARKRTLVPLFSGRRVPMPLGEVSRLALDATSAMVLNFLGLLPKVLSAFNNVVIPAGMMRELFEGQRKIRGFQRSQFTRASQIMNLLSQRLKVLETPDTPPKDLLELVGIDLATLLHNARRVKGIVVRPAPVYQLASQGREIADLSAYSDCLTDTHALLKVLRAAGAVDQESAETADRYFKLQDAGWTSPALPDVHRPLYLDDVAVSYLQTTNLLSTVVEVFDEVYIHSGAEEEASALMNRERQSEQVVQHIQQIREAISASDREGRIVFGPRRTRQEDDDTELSTLHLLSDWVGAQAVVIDDRVLNKEPFVIGPKGEQARTATTLDIIEDLRFRSIISEEQRLELRYRLRAAGAALVPVDSCEVRIAAHRSSDVESAEFRAFSESVSLARIRNAARFPAEIPWLISVMNAVRSATKETWLHEKDKLRAERLADLIVSELPNAADWVPLWGGAEPPGWVEAVAAAMT